MEIKIEVIGLRTRRGRLEIIMTILQQISDGVIVISQLMLKTKLGYYSLKDYLTFLTEQGFLTSIVRYNNHGKKGFIPVYSITDEGTSLFEPYHTLTNKLKLSEMN